MKIAGIGFNYMNTTKFSVFYICTLLNSLRTSKQKWHHVLTSKLA